MSEVLKLTNEEPTVGINDLPRAKPINPMEYTEEEIMQNTQWSQLLRIRHPDMPQFLIDACIDYFRIRGAEELQREIDEGKFDKKQ